MIRLNVNEKFSPVFKSVPEIIGNTSVSLDNLWTNMEIISQFNVYTNIQDQMYGCGKPGNFQAWSGRNTSEIENPFKNLIKEKIAKISLICNRSKTETYLMIPTQIKQRLAMTFCKNLGKL
jgi:hypothetical protein